MDGADFAGTKQDEEDDYNELFKVVLVGDAGVGKTHIMNRYKIFNLHFDQIRSGITTQEQCTNHWYRICSKDRATEEQCQDKGSDMGYSLAGQERYRGITSTHFRRAGGALVVYDVTKEKSFESVQKWIEELRYQAEPDIVIMLVGNKIDLVEKNPQARKVQKETAKDLANQQKVLFEESSAVTGQNVVSFFELLLQEMYSVKQKTGGLTNNPIGVKLNNNSGTGSGNDECKC